MNNDDISISMIIDNGIKNSNTSSTNFKPLPLKNSINLNERRVY